MKIVLIHPPWLHSAGAKYYYPLGLGYIAAYLRRAGHDVKVFDPQPRGWSYEQLWRELAQFGPDLVGVTAMTQNVMLAIRIATEAKRRLGCLVVLGGIHPSALPRSTLLGAPGIDAVIAGEGELPMAAIAADFDARGKVDFGRIPGASFLEDGKYRENPRPEPISDLDSLPYPFHEPAHLPDYYEHRYFRRARKSTVVLSSRGCPGRCGFCSHLVRGPRLHLQSPEYFVGELEYLVREHGITDYHIDDDCFTADAGRVSRICDLILSRRLNITWAIYGRVDTLLDEKLVRKMKRAGFWNILIGIESGSQRLLDLMNKGATLEQAEKCCGILRKCGIGIINSYILGNEGETEETARETIAFALKLKADVVNMGIMAPYPGAPLFDKYYKDYDRPDTDWENWGSAFNNRPYEPRHTELTMNDLFRLQSEAFRLYNRNPRRALNALLLTYRMGHL